MTRQRIVLKDTNMSQMTPEQQEDIWRLSRDNDVFETDINGCEWQILDMTTDNDEPESVMLRLKTKKENDVE